MLCFKNRNPILHHPNMFWQDTERQQLPDEGTLWLLLAVEHGRCSRADPQGCAVEGRVGEGASCVLLQAGRGDEQCALPKSPLDCMDRPPQRWCGSRWPLSLRCRPQLNTMVRICAVSHILSTDDLKHEAERQRTCLCTGYKHKLSSVGYSPAVL